MAKPQGKQPARQNQVRAMKNDQSTRSSIPIDEPSRATKREATVYFNLTSNGGWILRAYSNESTIERLKLERTSKATQQQINAKETPILSGSITTLVYGTLSKVRNDYASQIAAAGKPSSSHTNTQPVAGSTRSWIRLEDGIWYDPRLAPEGDPLDINMIEPRTASHFKGTATSGYSKPYPGETGKWYFQTVGDDESYSEGAAAMNMGGQGIFKPDKDRPTAQDVADYRKCNKAYGSKTDGVSDGIVIVWRPDSWSPPHQEKESYANVGAGIESQRRQDQVDRPEDEIDQSSGNRASSVNRSSLRGRSPSPPSKPRVHHPDEVVESMEVDEQDDPNKLMPPPALPPATPLEQRENTIGDTIAEAIASTAASWKKFQQEQREQREDTPLPESDRKKRKRKSSEAGRGSSQKARKSTKSSKDLTVLNVFKKSCGKSGDDEANAMEVEEEVEQDDVDESHGEEDME